MERKRGEEFRDDLRGVHAASARNDVRRLLAPAVLAELTRLNPWRTAFAILQTVAIAGAALAIAWTQFAPWVVIPAVLLIGTQEHALFVLAHDAAHYRLFESRRLNDSSAAYSARWVAFPWAAIA